VGIFTGYPFEARPLQQSPQIADVAHELERRESAR
jgi:hypothetical protein